MLWDIVAAARFRPWITSKAAGTARHPFGAEDSLPKTSLLRHHYGLSNQHSGPARASGVGVVGMYSRMYNKISYISWSCQSVQHHSVLPGSLRGQRSRVEHEPWGTDCL